MPGWARHHGLMKAAPDLQQEVRLRGERHDYLQPRCDHSETLDEHRARDASLAPRVRRLRPVVVTDDAALAAFVAEPAHPN